MDTIQIHIAILCVHPPGDRNLDGTVDPQDKGLFHDDCGPPCTPDSGPWLLHLDADEDVDNYFKGASPMYWVGDFRHRFDTDKDGAQRQPGARRQMVREELAATSVDSAV